MCLENGGVRHIRGVVEDWRERNMHLLQPDNNNMHRYYY